MTDTDTGGSARRRFPDAYRESAQARWATLSAVLVFGWLLFFWALNALWSDSGSTAAAPQSTVQPAYDD